MEYKIDFSNDEIKDCFKFAKEMIGKHNPNIIGERDDREIFRDDIRGKLGEFAFKKYINKELPDMKINGEIDLSVNDRGKWDNYDLIINNSNISVKSIKPISVALMIESKRFNSDGSYIYKNNDGSEINVDYYVLVKVGLDPDINWEDVKTSDFNKFKNPDKSVRVKEEWVKNGTQTRIFNATILGGISHEDFWEQKKFMSAGMKLTVKNLNALLLGDKNVNDLPEKRNDCDKKNNIMQVDNYGIHMNFLRDINELDI